MASVRPSMGIRSRPLEKTSFFCQNRQNCVKIAFSTAWVRPSMGIRSRPLEKMTYFLQNDEIFHVGGQIGCKSRKTTFYVFWLFTPLFRRFTLSGVVFEIEHDETHRLVSSILHFMPSGSISKFSIDFR